MSKNPKTIEQKIDDLGPAPETDRQKYMRRIEIIGDRVRQLAVKVGYKFQ